jgi:hypothetical protein
MQPEAKYQDVGSWPLGVECDHSAAAVSAAVDGQRGLGVEPWPDSTR